MIFKILNVKIYKLFIYVNLSIYHAFQKKSIYYELFKYLKKSSVGVTQI